MGKKEDSQYVIRNYTVYFSSKLADLYKPILYPYLFDDAPLALYYRIVGNNLGEYCIEYFYYWKDQNCTLPLLSHKYDYEAIFVYLTENGPNPDKIVNGGLGGPECLFHKNETRPRQGHRDELEHHVATQLSEFPYYPFANKGSRDIEVCVKNYPLDGNDLEFEGTHPKFGIRECSHVYSGARDFLEGQPFSTTLRELDDNVLHEWYYDHYSTSDEMPFGHDIADPFTAPYIKYRDARPYLPKPSS